MHTFVQEHHLVSIFWIKCPWLSRDNSTSSGKDPLVPEIRRCQFLLGIPLLSLGDWSEWQWLYLHVAHLNLCHWWFWTLLLEHVFPRRSKHRSPLLSLMGVQSHQLALRAAPPAWLPDNSAAFIHPPCYGSQEPQRPTITWKSHSLLILTTVTFFSSTSFSLLLRLLHICVWVLARFRSVPSS